MATTVESPWEIQRRVIFALFVRELGNRFGRYRLGVLWAVAEPLAAVLVLVLIRSVLGRGDIGGINAPLFFASGVIPFFLFNTILMGNMGSVEGSLGMMSFRRVQAIDAILATTLLDVLSSVLVAVLVLLGFRLAGVEYTWNDTLQVAATFACLVVMAFGLALVFAMVAPLVQELKKILPVCTRPLFFISGIFFPAASVPQPARDFLLWNPLLHVVELFRAGLFVEATSQEGSLPYLGCCAAGSLALGLIFYHVLKRKVMTSGMIK